MKYSLVKKPECFFIYAFLVAFSAIVFALYYQYFEGYEPCVFCIYQRIPYGLVIFFSLICLFLRTNSNFFQILILLFFFSSLVLSTTHFGIEQGYWSFSTSCSSNVNEFDNIEQLRSSLMNASITKCDEILWSYRGISMAGYNMIFSFVNLLLLIFYKFKVVNEKK